MPSRGSEGEAPGSWGCCSVAGLPAIAQTVLHLQHCYGSFYMELPCIQSEDGIQLQNFYMDSSSFADHYWPPASNQNLWCHFLQVRASQVDLRTTPHNLALGTRSWNPLWDRSQIDSPSKSLTLDSCCWYSVEVKQAKPSQLQPEESLEVVSMHLQWNYICSYSISLLFEWLWAIGELGSLGWCMLCTSRPLLESICLHLDRWDQSVRNQGKEEEVVV